MATGEIRLKSLEDIQFYIIDLIDRCGDEKEYEKGKRSLLQVWQNAERMKIISGPRSKRKDHRRHSPSKNDRLFIIEKFKETCAYCGKKGNGNYDHSGKIWHLDHIIPYSWNYSNGRDNLVLSCSGCNVKKGAHWWCPTPPSLALKHKSRGVNG